VAGSEKKAPSIRGFLLDEHIQASCVDALVEMGWKAAQPGHDPLGLDAPPKGTDDPVLLKWAAKRRFCFVTEDRGLAQPGAVPAKHSGVAILVCDHDEELSAISNLAKAARRPELGSALTNWRFAFDGNELLPIAPDGSIGWRF